MNGRDLKFKDSCFANLGWLAVKTMMTQWEVIGRVEKSIDNAEAWEESKDRVRVSFEYSESVPGSFFEKVDSWNYKVEKVNSYSYPTEYDSESCIEVVIKPRD